MSILRRFKQWRLENRMSAIDDEIAGTEESILDLLDEVIDLEMRTDVLRQDRARIENELQALERIIAAGVEPSEPWPHSGYQPRPRINAGHVLPRPPPRAP